MKTSIRPTIRKQTKASFKTRMATIAGAGMLALGTAFFVAPAHAGPLPEQDGPFFTVLIELLQQAQIGELDQLAANFHGALSYGGNITNMMSLWADNSSISLNGVRHVGKAAVQAFFQSSGYFLNNWVSLAPEYKTVITLNGGTAQISTQCVGIDLNASPMVVKGVIQVHATCQRIRGKWLFTSMNNTGPAPL